MTKINLLLKLSGTCLLFSFSIGLFAQDLFLPIPPDSIRRHTLSNIVITANRHNAEQQETPAAIDLVTEKTIQQFQLRTTPEALLQSPGVFVQKTNHGGGSPFLRGLTGNQTLLLVDGIRLSNSIMRYGPNQYFNTIDVFNTEKIEVLRGDGSVQYGSDALGGTIQAFSPDLAFSEKPTISGNLLTRLATQGMEQSAHGNLLLSQKKSTFRAGLTARNFGDLIGGAATGRQSPTGYKEFNFDLKGKLELSATSILTIAYQNVHQSDVPVYHKILLENYAVNKMNPQKRDLAYLKLNQNLKGSILKSAAFTASLQHNEEGRVLQKNNSSTLRNENDRVRTLSFSAEAFSENKQGWSATSGIEIYNDLVNSSRSDKNTLTSSTTSKRGLYPDGSTMTSLSMFSLHSLDLHHWKISAGLRFNTYKLKVSDEVIGQTKLSPSALVGNFALQRKLSFSSNLFLSVNTGFRAPNLDDLGSLGIVDFRYETPNFNLRPEHSIQYQLGYKYQYNRIKGEFFIYRNELRDLIVRNRIAGDSIEGYPVYKKENVERAYIQGIETAWSAELGRSFSLTGSLTYTYGQNLTKNEPVRRIPPLFGRLALDYKHKNWWCNLEWLSAAKQSRLATGDKEDNRIPSGGTPGWSIFNINTSYSVRKLQLDLNLINLFNQDYRYHGSGVNGYGRSANITVSYKI